MRRIDIYDKRRLAEIVPQRGGEDVVVERDGRPVALITRITGEDYDLYMEESNAAFIKSIATARKQVKQGRTISHQELKRRLGMK